MKITPSGKRVLLLFATDRNRPAMHVSGTEMPQDQFAVFGLHWPYYLRSSAGCGWGTMSLTPEDLAAASEVIIGRPLAPPSFPVFTIPPGSVASRLSHLHEATGHLARTVPDVLAKPEVSRAIEEALVEAMVLCLAEGQSNEVRNAHRHRATVMRRLEETLEANTERPLYMPDLCATVGASYTSLHDCCRMYLGMSPKRYLWLRRMHLARRALRGAQAPSATVTEIATNYGFWELGRFAVAYRSLFGESPSAALHRPPDRQKSGRIYSADLAIR
jgi:AraC-like DNA-binding protein